MIDAMVRKLDKIRLERRGDNDAWSVLTDMREILLAGKQEQPKETKKDIYMSGWMQGVDLRFKKLEVSPGGYQTLALRIEEANKKIMFLEQDRGKRLTEVEKRVDDLWSTVANVVKRMEDYDAKERPVAVDERLDDTGKPMCSHHAEADGWGCCVRCGESVSKPSPAVDDKLCPYCGGFKAIRNPTGKCDHLYYPDNVNKSLKANVGLPSKDEPKFLGTIDPCKDHCYIGAITNDGEKWCESCSCWHKVTTTKDKKEPMLYHSEYGFEVGKPSKDELKPFIGRLEPIPSETIAINRRVAEAWEAENNDETWDAMDRELKQALAKEKQ